jgi:phosphoglycolate phosphatase-like HAD superfamily hydrolase
VRAHLVWDWNGTLFHDTEVVVAASNAAFAEIGLPPLTVDRYRELYCFPIPLFYERLMGRAPTTEEWLRMDGAFHVHYAAYSATCSLAEGAELLLERWEAGGHSQSILSLYGHEELVPLVRGFGIERRFIRVDGRTGPSGGSKAEHMVRHLAALGEVVDRDRTVVIGDADDDALAAAHAGVRAVLHTGGSHTRETLAATGAAVVDSLAEAVALAEELVR